MNTGINKAIKDGNGNSIIFAALIGAAIANSIPTPFDSIYFQRINKFKQQYELGEISANTYEKHVMAEYYLWTSLWYVSIIGVLALFNKGYSTNAKILIGLSGAGLVYGAYKANLRRDKETEKLLIQKQNG